MSPRARPMVLCVALSSVALSAHGVAGARMAEGTEESPRSRSAPIIVANGACPAPGTIWSAMASLVPHGALDALPRAATVDISDLGETYRVRLMTNGVERIRVYRDVARDCEQRARFAAVFIVLTLMPPELLIDSPTRPPPEPAPVTVLARPAPVVPARAPRFLQLELAALGDAAPAMGSSAEVTSAGGELRVSLGRGPLVGLAAVGLQRPSDFTLGGLHGREQRVPFDIGARWRYGARWIELGGELGLAATLFRTEGVSPVVARQATRVDVGVRGGATLRFGGAAARIAPIAGLHATYFPRPYEIAGTPAGVVGQTPPLRVGATLGIAVSF